MPASQEEPRGAVQACGWTGSFMWSDKPTADRDLACAGVPEELTERTPRMLRCTQPCKLRTEAQKGRGLTGLSEISIRCLCEFYFYSVDSLTSESHFWVRTTHTGSRQSKEGSCTWLSVSELHIKSFYFTNGNFTAHDQLPVCDR